MDLTKGYTRLIVETCKARGLLRNQAAYVLATARWETAQTMKPVVEAFWLSEGWRRSNLRYYPWHGRGFVQLTWKENYRRAARALGQPLTKKPELALDPRIAAEILVVGCREGWFTGEKLSDHITLQRSDFRAARKIVNGLDKADEIAELARRYDAALKAEGYGEEQSPEKPVSARDEPAAPSAPSKPRDDAPAPAQGRKRKGLLAALLSALGLGGGAAAVEADQAAAWILGGVLLIAAIGVAVWLWRRR